MKNNHSKFMDGLMKLEKNILNSVIRTAETGLIEPFIEIPEELDPTFNISFDADFESLRNISCIYDFITSEISAQTYFGDGSISRLKEIYKEELKNEYISNDCVLLTRNTFNLMDLTLLTEFSKEISDAYYLIVNSIARDIVEAISEKIDENENSNTFVTSKNRLKTSLFESILDPDWDNNIGKLVSQSQFYRRIPDAYTAYNYEFLFRNRVMNHIAAGTYACVRDFLYKSNITPDKDNELFGTCYNYITHTYLFILDSMISILCKAFQHKVALCYNDIDILLDGLETEDETEQLLLEDHKA